MDFLVGNKPRYLADCLQYGILYSLDYRDIGFTSNSPELDSIEQIGFSTKLYIRRLLSKLSKVFVSDIKLTSLCDFSM